MLEVKNSKRAKVDLSTYNSDFGAGNKILRMAWNICYWILFRPFNLNIFSSWRALVLKMFGAKVGYNANIYASVKIWAPWNLSIGDYSSIGPMVDCYNQGKISIGNNTVISQKTYLCASTHDYTISNFPLIVKFIEIEDQVWVAADSFIAPGVIIGEGSVVGARSAVFRNVGPWEVVGGNPASFIKKRKIKQ
jgi:putative colanic acid biosynthesis acetyltransferase WcaF